MRGKQLPVSAARWQHGSQICFAQCLYRYRLVIPECKQNMMSLKGQASWAKMMSLNGKLRALAYHRTKTSKQMSNEPFSLQILVLQI
jgi:hypothetical protein